MLRYTTDRAWFSRLLRHQTRKWSGSIVTTPEPARGTKSRKPGLLWNLDTKHSFKCRMRDARGWLSGDYLLLPQNADHGVAQLMDTLSGMWPGVDTLCSAVDSRLACTATRLPPTPAVTQRLLFTHSIYTHLNIPCFLVNLGYPAATPWFSLSTYCVARQPSG